MRLLLHLCCGPCAVMPFRRLLEEGHELTPWFMNPNIQPLAEYLRRREAAEICTKHYGLKLLYADDTWDLTKWLRQVVGRDEKPLRCAFCTTQRLEAAFAKARALDLEGVSTTLLYSIYQPHEHIKQEGERLARETGLNFVYRDFRVDWQAGIDGAKSLGLYRQPYCGCVYSEVERYQKKLKRLNNESSLAKEGS